MRRRPAIEWVLVIAVGCALALMVVSVGVGGGMRLAQPRPALA